MARRIDHAIGRSISGRRVLVDVRTPMNLAVLRPVWSALIQDRRVAVAFSAEQSDAVREALASERLEGALISRSAATWKRWDLVMTADAWNHTPVHRCRRRLQFFHGVAGKYDLDAPAQMCDAGLDRFDRVAFINEERLLRYVQAGLVSRERAVLVGYPKADDLINGHWSREAVRGSLALDEARPTVVYAPTFSVASSLHLAGMEIIQALLESDVNVIVKLHDRSMTPDAHHTAGIDWPDRLSVFAGNTRFVLARGADAEPFLAAADILVTDHSTVGFEFALLDRPIVVFDAPELQRAARVDVGKWELLRSMATVVRTPAEMVAAVQASLANPTRHAGERRRAHPLFANPGTATARARDVVYELLGLPMPATDARRTAAQGWSPATAVLTTSIVGKRVTSSPAETRRPKFSVVIATYNRAGELRRTLASIGGLRTADGWELIVVDNNSTDDTAAVVRDYARDAAIPVRYVLETVPGRSAALNAGIMTSGGDIIVTTDDDVRVEPDWLEQAGAALERLQCGYIGGRVLPLWGTTPPAWLSRRGGPHWAVIALLDYGPTSLELTTRMPLGVNMAFRREVFDLVGGWDDRVGRKAGTLLGQEVREWCIRARAKGVRGFYVPELIVHHVIPANRLQKRYFRRWFYWRGISRALLFQHQGLDMESPQETRHDFRQVPMIAGVPRYLYRGALRHAAAAIAACVRGRHVEAFEAELWLWMFAGILRQRWRDRHNGFVKVTESGTHPRTGTPVGRPSRSDDSVDAGMPLAGERALRSAAYSDRTARNL